MATYRKLNDFYIGLGVGISKVFLRPLSKITTAGEFVEFFNPHTILTNLFRVFLSIYFHVTKSYELSFSMARNWGNEDGILRYTTQATILGCDQLAVLPKFLNVGS